MAYWLISGQVVLLINRAASSLPRRACNRTCSAKPTASSVEELKPHDGILVHYFLLNIPLFSLFTSLFQVFRWWSAGRSQPPLAVFPTHNSLCRSHSLDLRNRLPVQRPSIRKLKQWRRRRLRKRHLKIIKWIRAASNFIAFIPSRSIRQMLVFCSGAEF